MNIYYFILNVYNDIVFSLAFIVFMYLALFSICFVTSLLRNLGLFYLPLPMQ